ncbi:manganese efflux pump MntP [Gehongia tenuis]|uniref:Putative manganese efflux pump MntP n=1 Tax=Gehongia tenuis TaxID=2763655 RepID=A0A926HPT8_9FIRM|nr:manganese efflux pump MntP family protein [Gehongia tenuis]MBC8530541.1 manganese efflux pump [Gehongia tenuis]
MSILEILLIAVGLAMDAFAVSICNGITVRDFGKREALLQGAYFGLFQFAMTAIGYFAGRSVSVYIENIDHWVAFGLLVVIGGHMIYESLTHKEEGCTKGDAKTLMSPKRMTLMAVATSIDALAVGVSLAILSVNIWLSAAVIGVVAFAFGFGGGFLGRKVGSLIQKWAEVAGGGILVLTGVKILVEHLFLGG